MMMMALDGGEGMWKPLWDIKQVRCAQIEGLESTQH